MHVLFFVFIICIEYVVLFVLLLHMQFTHVDLLHAAAQAEPKIAPQNEKPPFKMHRKLWIQQYTHIQVNACIRVCVGIC